MYKYLSFQTLKLNKNKGFQWGVLVLKTEKMGPAIEIGKHYFEDKTLAQDFIKKNKKES